MATTTISITCFTPQAFARPKTRNPNPKKHSRNPKPKFKPQHTSYKPAPEPVSHTDFGGGEATTYTRLPPIDDIVTPSITLTSHSSMEVKLSDSTVAKASEVDEKDKEEKEHDDLEKGEDDLHVDYGGFQVFEVNSDSEDVDEDYDYENYKNFNYELEGGGAEEGDQNANYVNLKHNGDLDVEDNYFNYVLDEGEGEEEEEEEEDKNEKHMKFEYDDDLEVKEKGVPAIMRCFDQAKIYVKAGNGGNGVVAFRREKFVPLGGPSGGDGGRGGNVYVEVDESMNSLLPFRNQVHFRAGRGAHGQGMMMNGAKGEDVVVKVAPGTFIREAGKEEVLLELLYPGQRALLLPGGRGGRGNAAFKCGSNKVPRIAENGEEGHEMWLELELKLVADVGIVGAPNAGKSTFLSVISAARPAIANYPFTTLLPNLGVVSFDYDSTMVVADLPGLLEGAHRGFGLGHEFLRHTERCLALVHVVDGSSEQPELEFDAVRLELEMFSPEIAEKPFVVAYNKMDLPEAYEKWPSFKESLQSRGIEVFCMSAVTREGTHEVICAAYELLQENKVTKKEHEGWTKHLDLNHVADIIQKQRRSPINDFEITHDTESNTWHVNGSGLQRFVQMTNWRYIDSERRFQHVLEACGVNKSLMKLGVKEGDTVIVGEMELVWHDSPDTSGSSRMKKQPSVSTKWPEWQ